MNNVTLIGNLVRDPELNYIPATGNAITKFTLAVSKGLSKEKEQEFKARNQPTVDFIDIVVFGKRAETVANHLVKGLKVAVEGKINTGSYEDKQGIKRKTFDIIANNVELLEWKDKQQNNMQGFQPTNDDVPF